MGMKVVRFRPARLTDYDAIKALDARLFPADKPVYFPKSSLWWVGVIDGEVVAYGGVQLLDGGTGYMLRAGVRVDQRGNGYQRRLLRIREAALRRIGFLKAVSDTS